METTGLHPPKTLPAKTYLRGPDIEARRLGLEAYLQAILEDKSLRASAVLKQFLEVPVPRQTRQNRDFYELVQDVRADLQLARRHLQSHNAESYVQIKKALNSAEKTFAEITTLERLVDVSEAETRRRRDVCDELHRESLSLMTLAQNYRHSAQGLHSQQTSNTSSDGGSPFAPKVSGGRRLGPAQETASTLSKTNEELLDGQTQIIHQQDELLSSLLPILQRQKELGNIIGQELDEQNGMLDDLGDSMDALEAKLKKGGKQITKITGKK